MAFAGQSTQTHRFSLVSLHVSVESAAGFCTLSHLAVSAFQPSCHYLRDSRSDPSNNRVKQSHGSQSIIRSSNALRIFTAWPHFTSDLPFGSWKKHSTGLKENTRYSSKIVCLDRSFTRCFDLHSICCDGCRLVVGNDFNPYSSGL